jgi:hypothetical protein
VSEKKVTFIQMVHSPSVLKDSGARLIFGIVNEVYLVERLRQGPLQSAIYKGGIDDQDMGFQASHASAP